MSLVIALVGRPNVGKSTLFNRLTRSRDAIVGSLSGLTRDRQYGRGVIGDIDYVVIDTGGLTDEQGGINKPRVPDPAKLPNNIFSGYFLFLSSGIDIFPTVATVAAEDPEIAAKRAHPTTFT